jgi:hypothetical protein
MRSKLRQPLHQIFVAAQTGPARELDMMINAQRRGLKQCEDWREPVIPDAWSGACLGGFIVAGGPLGLRL